MKIKFLFLSVSLTIFALSGCMNKEEILQVQDKTLPLKNAQVQEDVLSLKSASLKGKYIVILHDDDAVKKSDLQTRSSNVKKRASELQKNHEFSGEVEDVYETALQGFTVRMSPEEAKKMALDGNVKIMEADQIISLSPIETAGRHWIRSVAQTIPWGVTRVGGPGNGTGKTAWIIDTGIDKDHKDLKVDLKRSVSFVGRKTTPWDEWGHGTHVAGIIGALDNNIGVVGVAAGATLVSVRVLDSDAMGTISGLIAGINYVAEHGRAGDVANLSLGLTGISEALDHAVLEASESVKFVLAAGNSESNAMNFSPARVSGENIYTISAMDSKDKWAYFSNYGNPPIDYCAPGVDIYSTYMGGGYETMEGTSMAAPHVTGLLLIGGIKSDGHVIGDPDHHDDPIAHHR
jgi:subtilisin family serine protease